MVFIFFILQPTIKFNINPHICNISIAIQKKNFKMNKQVTFGHILTILAVIIVPLFVWGVNVERRFEQVISNTSDVKSIEKDVKVLQENTNENYIKILKELTEIKLELKDKQDR